MLRTMRKDFKKYSWTLWLVIIVFLLGFSFTDIFTGGSASDSVVAKIGKQEINAEQFQKRLFQVLDNYKNQMKNNFNKELITQMRIPEQILQNLINSAIIQNEANKLSLRATKGELKSKIVNFPAFQKDGNFVGITEYKRYLAIFRTNAKDFESDLKKDIVNNKLKEVVTASMIVDNTTLREQYKNENDSAEVEYVKLKINSEKSDFSASDMEVQNYFEKNKESFKTPEKRKGNIIVLKYDDFRKDLKLAETDFYNYFRSNKEQFQTPEKTRIYRLFMEYTESNREEILKNIEELKGTLNTENFESSAKIYSTDSKNSDGGDWGFSEWKSFTSQEQSIIKSLKQSEISDPVDTLSGFSILFAKEKESEKQEHYETAKPKIVNIMEREELRNIVKSKLDKIYAKVKGKTDLSAIKEDKSLSIIETEYLTSGEAVKDVEQFGYLSRKFFNMNEMDINYPVEFMDGIAIVQLTSVKEPEDELFENVKERVNEIVIADKQIVDAVRKSESFSSSLNNLSDKDQIEAFLKKNDLKLESVDYKRGNELADLGKDEGLDTIVFSSKEGQFSKPLRIGDNIAILRANEIKVTSEADFTREKTQFYKKKLEEIKNNYFISYIMGKRAKYQVGINQKLYDKIRESVVSRFN